MGGLIRAALTLIGSALLLVGAVLAAWLVGAVLTALTHGALRAIGLGPLP